MLMAQPAFNFLIIVEFCCEALMAAIVAGNLSLHQRGGAMSYTYHSQGSHGLFKPIRALPTDQLPGLDLIG